MSAQPIPYHEMLLRRFAAGEQTISVKVMLDVLRRAGYSEHDAADAVLKAMRFTP